MCDGDQTRAYNTGWKRGFQNPWHKTRTCTEGGIDGAGIPRTHDGLQVSKQEPGFSARLSAPIMFAW